jgi:hypothetical protein
MPPCQDNELVLPFLFQDFCEPRLVNQDSDFVRVFFVQSFADAILPYECAFRLDQFSQ